MMRPRNQTSALMHCVNVSWEVNPALHQRGSGSWCARSQSLAESLAEIETPLIFIISRI